MKKITLFLGITFLIMFLGISVLASENSNLEIYPTNSNPLQQTVIAVSPADQNVEVGVTFTTEIMIYDVENLGGFDFEIAFDPAIVQGTNIELGTFISSTGRTPFILENEINNTTGVITYAVLTTEAPPPSGPTGPTGDGVLVTITWESIAQGISALDLYNVEVFDPAGATIPSDVTDGNVNVIFDVDIDVYAPVNANEIINEQILVPITIPDDNLTGKEIFSYGFKLHFDETVISPVADGYSISGTISQGCNVAYNITNPGYVILSVSTPLPLEGNGVLINLLFDVVGNVNDTTSLTFSESSFNEGDLVMFVPHDGHLTIIDVYDIAGTVTYFMGTDSGGGIINDLTISASGDTTLNVTTDADGNYLFENLLLGDYAIAPVNNQYLSVPVEISGYDASLALQADAQLITLTPHQQIAGDVSGNGTVTHFDASLIARFVAGYITEFDAGAWSFDPNVINFTALAQDISDQDFVGIGIGDISGNGNEPLPIQRNANVSITTDVTQLPPNTTTTIPLYITWEDEEVFSYYFIITMENLTFVDVESAGTLSDGWTVMTNPDESNDIHLVAYHTNQLEDDGLLLNLICETGNEGTANLTLDNVLINEASTASCAFAFNILATVINDESLNSPTQYVFGQNYPNPFNPETEFNFALPEAGHVTLTIYDMAGKLISKVLDQHKNSGYHTAVWNCSTEDISSGTYLSVLSVNDFIQTRKLIILK